MRASWTPRAALIWALCLGPWAVAAECEPWPGEPDPLPTVEDPDALRAEWAALRTRELGALARGFEGRHALRARQLWQHLLCLDPTNDEAQARVQRGAAVRLHRPVLRDEPFRGVATGEAWPSLDAPLGVRSVQRVVEGDTQGELFEQVRELDEQVRQARFEGALESAERLRDAIDGLPPGDARVQLLVETEVLAATAELALGREQAAEASLRRALEAYPALELDVSSTSPKVLRALEAARAAAGSPP